MDTVLGLYMIGSAVVLFIVFCAMIGHGASNKDTGIAGVGIVGLITTLTLFVFSTKELHKPKAIEVYQGKTTLEYTVKDGVKTDSVVVYKDGSKRD